MMCMISSPMGEIKSKRPFLWTYFVINFMSNLWYVQRNTSFYISIAFENNENGQT